MKTLIFAIALSFGAGANSLLNCHTDSAPVEDGLLRSYDMSLPMHEGDTGFVPGGKLFQNTFPPHHAEPNPHLKVETFSIEIKDAMLGARGEALVYFSAGAENFVLNVEKTREDKYEGTLKKHGPSRVSLPARCYLYPLF